MAKLIDYLAPNVPIVDPKTGNPTAYFAEILARISDAKISASLIDALGGDPGSDQVVTWDDTAGDLDFKPASDVLDMIGAEAHGDILYRDSAAWALLPAGTDGDVLTTHGASADPTWETPSSGSSFERTRVKPVAANFTLDNAGTATIVDGTHGVKFTIPSSTVNVRFARLTAGPPATPYSIIIRAESLSAWNANAVHLNSILLRNSTSGRIINMANTGQNFVIQGWTNYTTFTSTILSIAMADANGLVWRKLENDGTNLNFYVSVNGTDWSLVATTTLAAFINAAGGTVDQIGFGMINGTASGRDYVTLFESWEVV